MINFEELAKANENSHDVIMEYEKSLKRLDLLKNLREHDGMKILLENFQNEIEYINKVLISNENIDDDGRKYLFIKKHNAEFMLDLFNGLEKHEEEIMIGVNNLQEGK